MGWLIGPAIMSLIASFFAVKLFDFIFGHVTGGVVSVARAGVFIGTWTAVTTRAGMQGFSKKAKQLQASNQIVKALTKGEKL